MQSNARLQGVLLVCLEVAQAWERCRQWQQAAVQELQLQVLLKGLQELPHFLQLLFLLFCADSRRCRGLQLSEN